MFVLTIQIEILFFHRIVDKTWKQKHKENWSNEIKSNKYTFYFFFFISLHISLLLLPNAIILISSFQIELFAILHFHFVFVFSRFPSRICCKSNCIKISVHGKCFDCKNRMSAAVTKSASWMSVSLPFSNICRCKNYETCMFHTMPQLNLLYHFFPFLPLGECISGFLFLICHLSYSFVHHHRHHVSLYDAPSNWILFAICNRFFSV